MVGWFGVQSLYGDECDIREWATAAAKSLGGEICKIYVRSVCMKPFFDAKFDYGAFYELGPSGQKKLARGIVPHVQAITRWPLDEKYTALTKL